MRRAVLMLALACALSACGTPEDPQAPVATVQRFIAGLEARDATRVLAEVAPDGVRRQIAPDVRTYLSVVERLAFRDPTYTLLANANQKAQVRVTATLSYTVRGGQMGERPVQAEFSLVRQQNVWYLDTITWPPLGQEGP